MEQSTVSFVQWWTKQKMADKLPILLVIALIFSVTMNVRQAGSVTSLQQDKETARIECEQRLEKRLTAQRNFDDSLRNSDRLKYEDQVLSFYTDRTNTIAERNKKIDNSLNKLK